MEGRSLMVRIETVETLIVEIPTVRAHILAMATMRTQTVTLVRIRSSDGIEGIGEGTTIGGLAYGPESPSHIKLTIDDYIAPLMIGRDASHPAEIMRAIDQSIVGNSFARNAVETALLDAHGKRLGVPLSELLGGRLRSHLPVLWTLASGDAGRDVEEAEEMLERRRHQAFKIKIGKRALAEDVAHVAAIKKALGDRASVRVDVNQAWDEGTARRGVDMLADVGIDLVEQPVAAKNRVALARLAARSRVPIMADETLQGPQDAYELARTAGADVFAVKIAQSGGLFRARDVGAIGHAAGIGLYGGTMLEAGIGTVASAHLCATLPALAWGTELFGPLLLTAELLAEPLEYRDFGMVVPATPGLGVTLNDEVLAFHRIDQSPRRSSGAVSTAR